MCFSLLFGLLLGGFVAKMAFRRRLYHAGLGGGCGKWRNHLGPIAFRGGHGFGGFDRFAAGMKGFEKAVRGVDVDAVVRDLELSKRQEEAARPVLTLLSDQLGDSPLRLRGALQTVAADSFDKARIEAVVSDLPGEVKQQLLDGLEHLHDILIPEQREALRGRL